MPPILQQSRSAGGEDIYFEPIDAQNPGHNVEIKQDIISDDGYPHSSIEDQQRKSWIGAYRDSKGGLPAEKGFPIQIGSELFRLSGASLMSDAPSYFSKFFQEQIRNSDNVNGSVKTLYIDRDPETFRDIARHLQGYHVHPRDGQHYVRLFSDAQFYSLPRLNKQLFESDMYIRIGERDFKISRDLFSSPGDSPNFFSLGFGVFPNQEGELYPGLDREGLIRPPPAEAPELQSRSASTFADLLQLLRGYPLQIRNAEHRAELLRDCRYYHFKGLEQKIIFHNISFNPERQTHEILMRIEDLRQPGISIHFEPISPTHGYLQYTRPYTDDQAHDLIIETGNESSRLHPATSRIEFSNGLETRMTSLLQVISAKLPTSLAILPPSISNASNLRVSLDTTTHILLDGADHDYDHDHFPTTTEAKTNPADGESSNISKKRKLTTTTAPLDHNNSNNNNNSNENDSWLIKRGQWRVEIQTVSERERQIATGAGMSVSAGAVPVVEVVLVAVKVDAVRGEWGRNRARGFLVG